MSVYVDASLYAYGRMVMCHMIADTPDELHAMADRIGVARRWFQARASFPHYDVCKSKRAIAVAAGAIECDRNAFVAHMRRLRPAWGVYGPGNPAPPRPCKSCEGRGWLDEECESAIAGMSVPSHLRFCDDCGGTGRR